MSRKGKFAVFHKIVKKNYWFFHLLSKYFDSKLSGNVKQTTNEVPHPDIKKVNNVLSTCTAHRVHV